MKIGLIGAGNSAMNIAKSMNSIEGSEIIEVAAKTVEEAQKIADERNIAKATTTEELLKNPDIEAVIISVPHSLHHPITIQALNAGKHVLCEKPLAINMVQGNEMIALAQEKNLKLGTFFQMRFNDASVKAKEIVESGDLGKLLHSQAHVFWSRDQPYYDESPWRGKWATEGGGSLINQSVHTIDLMMWLVGQPKKVFGVFGAKTHDIEVDDNAAAVVIFENGAYGTIQTSTSCDPGYTAKMNIFGSKGGISLIGQKLTWTKENGDVEEMDFEKAQVGSANDPKKFNLKAQVAVIVDFIGAVTEDRLPKIDGAEGLRAIDVIEAIYKSKGEKVIEF